MPSLVRGNIIPFDSLPVFHLKAPSVLSCWFFSMGKKFFGPKLVERRKNWEKVLAKQTDQHMTE